ncbi:hypothetical protein ACQ4PT_005281 [Festuca glaucescens]
MNRGAGRAPGRGGDGRGRQFPIGGNGRGGGRYPGANPFARQRNFVQGESSGSAAWDDHGGDRFQDNNGDGGGFGNAGGFGNGGFGNFHRGSGYGYNARRNYTNQYQRQGNYQQRNQSPAGGYRGVNSRSNYAAGVDGVRRDGGIDQDLLQQTVQAVVAAVTSASHKPVNQPDVSTIVEGNAPGPVHPTGTQSSTVPVVSSVMQPALMFFEIPFRGTYKPKVENAKLAKVKFPSKNEVQRMKKFKTYPVPNRATDMEFDEWSVMEEPTFMLPEVWLRVTGIPSDVRNDYIALWALGSLFGKTMEVDMAFTRKTKVLRLRIGCMDASLIPETTDVYISRDFFRLAFEVENKNLNAEIDMAEDPHNDGNNNGGDGGNEENRRNENNKDEVTHMEVEQTMNPGANQGLVGDNRNNASFKQNNLMVTFVQPQKDRKLADFEVDLVLDHVPIIGGSGSSSMVVPDQLVTAGPGHLAAAEQTTSASAHAQGCLQARGQVEGAGQLACDTRTVREASEAGSRVPTPDTQKTGSSTLHNGAVFSVLELGEKLTGASVASNIAGVKNDGMVVSDQNPNFTHDSLGFSSTDVSEIVQTNDQALDGVATGFQKRMPKKANVPTEDEVIAFCGIAPTLALARACVCSVRTMLMMRSWTRL